MLLDIAAKEPRQTALFTAIIAPKGPALISEGLFKLSLRSP